MRSVTDRGYPIIGRKANRRENVPAKIYWMLARGPLDEHEIVVRTCGMRLCVNPDHGRVTDRREHGAERMREGSQLDWEAVHEIRSTLSASQEVLRERAAQLAARFGWRAQHPRRLPQQGLVRRGLFPQVPRQGLSGRRCTSATDRICSVAEWKIACSSRTRRGIAQGRGRRGSGGMV
jgi:hypothetical protein